MSIRDPFDTAELILANLVELSLKWIRMCFDATEWQTLRNTASRGPVWPPLESGDHIRSRIWSMNDLVNKESEVRNLGFRLQVMACMAQWSKIERIWPEIAYNCPS